jgi:PEP-CTERM motif
MKKVFLCSFLFIFAFAANLYAIPIVGDTANSTEGLGDFEGSFDFSAVDDNNAQIDIVLKNTSDVSNHGFLVAFAFNNPDGLITGVTLAGPSTFSLIGDPTFENTIPASPFGDFDIGGATDPKGDNPPDPSWLGGGSPTGGIAVNQTATFKFDLVGTGFSSLTTQDFISELVSGGEEWFAARFRGFDDGGSDKVPAAAVPEPTTVLLVGIGLLGLVGPWRKKFKN